MRKEESWDREGGKADYKGGKAEGGGRMCETKRSERQEVNGDKGTGKSDGGKVLEVKCWR